MELDHARRLWTVLEPYHASAYFSPEVAAAMKDVGLKGYWMGYFAGRAAPMGPVTPDVVTATFYNFAPRMVHRALPDAWSFASPAKIVEARTKAVDATLRRLLGDLLGADEVADAAALAKQAIDGADAAGRALYGGHLSLPWPDDSEPHMVLWHAATLLREHRGDGHVIALAHAGVDGCEAHVMSPAGRRVLQPNRGWTDEEWEAAEDRLRARGWLTAGEGSTLTDAGQAVRQGVEEATDRLALGPCEALGEDDWTRLLKAMAPIAGRIVAEGGVPFPNPMGAPDPPV